MTWLLIATLLLSVLIGLSLGLLGGGGSILTVPVLTYVAGMDAKEAITTSLFVVGITSAVSLIGHARNGRVKWRTGLFFGAASMAGAFLGGLFGGHIPGAVLMIAFAVMMVVTSVAMLRGRRSTGEAQERESLPILKVLLEGLAVGGVTGLIGAGGGFLVVPVLALLGGLAMPTAVGTSLLVISVNSFPGFGGHLASVSVDWGLVAMVSAAAIIGSLIGARLVSVVPEAGLRKGFGWFVLVMGVFVLVQELPQAAGLVVAIIAGVGALGAVVCRLIPACPMGARPATG